MTRNCNGPQLNENYSQCYLAKGTTTSRGHFTILIDHRNLIHLFNLRGSDVNGRLWRWAAKLSEYDFTAKYIPGEENVAARLSQPQWR